MPPHLWRQALDMSGKLWRGFHTGTLQFPSGGLRVPRWNLNLALTFTPFLPLCFGPKVGVCDSHCCKGNKKQADKSIQVD